MCRLFLFFNSAVFCIHLNAYYYSRLAGRFFLDIPIFLRIPPASESDENLLYASADGYVFSIEENVKAPAYIEEPVHKILIFMHVASVHWNYSPMEGKIGFLDYRKGQFKNVIKPAAWDVNEHLLIGMENDKKKTKILISMIAGLIARRIRFFRETDSHVGQGERFGLIKYGSANAIYLPASEFEITVKSVKNQSDPNHYCYNSKMKKIIHIVPNFVTFLNLFSGFLSIYLSFKDEIGLASMAIMLATIFDLLDGRLARVLGVSSEMGKELDSFSDLTTFGIAPAFLFFNFARPYGLLPDLVLLTISFIFVIRHLRLTMYIQTDPILR